MSNIDWSQAQNQYNSLISVNGELLQFLNRVESGSNAYSSGSTTTYGYGDITVYWVTGSLRAMVEPVRHDEVVIEAGFYEADYMRLWIASGESVDHWEQVIYPSGSGIKYVLGPIESHRLGSDVVVTQSVIIRRTTPRSGSAY